MKVSHSNHKPIKVPMDWLDELESPVGHPGADWHTGREIAAKWGLAYSTTKKRLQHDVEKGLMVQTNRVVNGKWMMFYRPKRKK